MYYDLSGVREALQDAFNHPQWDDVKSAAVESQILIPLDYQIQILENNIEDLDRMLTELERRVNDPT